MRYNHMRRQRILLDLDGTLHAYTSGWVGEGVVADEPVPGTLNWLIGLVDRYEVAIFSTRCRQAGGVLQVRRWLHLHGVPAETVERLQFTAEKLPAHLAIDDRCLRFTGEPIDERDLEAFRPWNLAEEPLEGADEPRRADLGLRAKQLGDAARSYDRLARDPAMRPHWAAELREMARTARGLERRIEEALKVSDAAAA